VVVFGVEKLTALVEELHGLASCEEAVRKTIGNVDLILRFCRKYHARPFSKVGRAHTDVDGNVESFAFDHTTKLRLGMAELIVQAAQGVLGRTGVVVLNEPFANSQSCKFRLVVRLKEIPSGIPMHRRANLPDIRKSCLEPLQWSSASGDPFRWDLRH